MGWVHVSLSICLSLDFSVNIGCLFSSKQDRGQVRNSLDAHTEKPKPNGDHDKTGRHASETSAKETSAKVLFVLDHLQ